MLDFLNRTIVQPLVAYKRGSRHLRILKELERSQFDSPEAVRFNQFVNLKRQIDHAYSTVPYYRETWTAAGVHPSDILTFADIHLLPILSKSVLRTRGDEFRSESHRNADVRIKTTSGSTGVPLKIALDEPGAQFKTACTLRADQWSGWRLGQRVAKVWGNPEYRHFGLRGRLTNALVDRAIYLDTIGLNSQRIAEFATQLRRHKPGMIFGHAHSLYMLACALKKSKIDDIRPSGIVSTAMPLYDWQRVVIEAVFGIPVTNRYGCEEVSLIACQCERHGGLHIAAESVYVEVDGRTTGTGKLLITDLTNAAMPLIRYEIGDVATLAEASCPCGRGLPVIEKVEGRDADFVVTPAGGLISGISLTENFALHIRGAAQVQIIQESITHLRVRLVKDDSFGETSHRQLDRLVLDTFGPKMRCEVEFLDGIPQEPSGKYRFCISKVGREALEGLHA